MTIACRSHVAEPGVSVADVLLRHADACLGQYGDTLSVEMHKALQSIYQCRTRAMGGRSFHCAHCQKDHFAWHSCNHRLCPQCGAADTRDWVADQLAKKLSVEHFMVTFTLPSSLRQLCRNQPKVFLSAFFAASSQAIKDVLKQPKHLGAESGFIGVLQTWTQDLRLHPHIHYIVPAVGLDAKGKLKLPKKAGWLARGSIFANRMRTLLLQDLQKQGLLDQSQAKPLWKIQWNCDVESFGDGTNAIKYLGAYLKKGPVTQSRILGDSRGSVILSVKDRQNGDSKAISIDAAEFVRRYLQHALPQGFHAIRYYGLLHPRAKEKLASVCRQLGVRLKAKSQTKPASPDTAPLCPQCHKPMVLTGQLSRAPPSQWPHPNLREQERPAA